MLEIFRTFEFWSNAFLGLLNRARLSMVSSIRNFSGCIPPQAIRRCYRQRAVRNINRRSRSLYLRYRFQILDTS